METSALYTALQYPTPMNEKLAKIIGGIGHDYDYGAQVRLENKPLTASANGHFSDIGKLPNHPTFSTQSAYNTPEYPGGIWNLDKNNNHTFTPSPQMINSGATEGLAEYMRRVEPDVKLKAPAPYRKNIFK